MGDLKIAERIARLLDRKVYRVRKVESRWYTVPFRVGLEPLPLKNWALRVTCNARLRRTFSTRSAV